MEPGRDPQAIPLADIPFLNDKERLKDLPRGQISDSELNSWREANGGRSLFGTACYPAMSPASQLFGSTLHAGLIAFNDAKPVETAIFNRTHVAIDRFTGGAANSALFTDRLAPVEIPIETELTISNFALWQLGLLGLVFQEVNRGFARFGGGTRKGQGEFRIDVSTVTFRYSQRVYGNRPGGIVSAQTGLPGQDGYSLDTPHEVVDEASLVLLEDVPRELSSSDWRNNGTVRLVVDGQERMTLLFREAVSLAWVPWVERMRQSVEVVAVGTAN